MKNYEQALDIASAKVLTLVKSSHQSDQTLSVYQKTCDWFSSFLKVKKERKTSSNDEELRIIMRYH